MNERDWLDAETLRHCEKVAHSLRKEFLGTFSIETIDRFVDESLDHWRQARITTYIPVLLHRFVRERLQALGQVEGTLAKMTPEVLFVCTHNAGRSQMAAALVQLHAGARVHVRSAGSRPGDEVHPHVLLAMAELGMDLSEAFPKPLTDEVVRAADVVVTMGCGDACPIYPGKRYEDWEVADPVERSLEEVRVIRDEIDRRVRTLLVALLELEEESTDA